MTTALSVNHPAMWECLWIDAHPKLYKDRTHREMVQQAITGRLTLSTSGFLKSLTTGRLLNGSIARTVFAKTFELDKMRIAEMVMTCPVLDTKIPASEIGYQDYVDDVYEDLNDETEYTEFLTKDTFKHPVHQEIITTLFREFTIDKDEKVYYSNEGKQANLFIPVHVNGNLFYIELYFYL